MVDFLSGFRYGPHMDQRKLDIKIEIIRRAAEIGWCMRDVQLHIDHGTKRDDWPPYKRHLKVLKAVKREFKKVVLDNPEFNKIYFECILDGTIKQDYTKMDPGALGINSETLDSFKGIG